jgi:hypothetical protein
MHILSLAFCKEGCKGCLKLQLTKRACRSWLPKLAPALYFKYLSIILSVILLQRLMFSSKRIVSLSISYSFWANDSIVPLSITKENI